MQFKFSKVQIKENHIVKLYKFLTIGDIFPYHNKLNFNLLIEQLKPFVLFSFDI